MNPSPKYSQQLSDLVATTDAVGNTRSRKAKVEALAACVVALPAAQLELGVNLLAGELPEGKVGVGYAQLNATDDTPPAAESTLTLQDVRQALADVASTRGRGATAARETKLRALLARATHAEQSYLRRLLLGELRQGAQLSLLADAVARAADVPAAAVRRAQMLAGDLAAVARAALEGRLAAFDLEVLRPVGPMLAGSVESVGEAVDKLGRAVFDTKLDGARVQVHRAGDDVRVFSRLMNDVTVAAPEIVDAVRALPCASCVLDGEAIVMQGDGRPASFQVTMRRFGRRLDVEALRETLPLSVFFFDALHVDGESLIDAPLSERLVRLDALVPDSLRLPRVECDSPRVAQAFLDEVLRRGHEGVVAKAPDAPYEAGRRGSAWLKLKQARTLDLVVVAAEWGSGRRKGWLSNLHLAARDPATGAPVMVGKTFKGLTDAMLGEQTARLLALETGRDGHVVHVRPELVVEIAFNEVQRSRQYPGGVALRFARVKGYRFDKGLADADAIDSLRALAPADA